MAECIEEGMLRAYTDGALAPEQEASISIHLAQCERCSRNLAEVSALASEVGSLVRADLHPPDPRLALAQVRGTMRTTAGRTFADVSPAVVAYTGETPKRRASSRPMRLQPVAMGVGLGAAMVAVLLLLFAVSGLQQTASKPGADFMPAGMVRHITVSHTYTTTAATPQQGQPDGTSIEEIWLTNGKSHLLRYSTRDSIFRDSGSETWVAEDAVYIYNYSPASKTTVYKYPYDARHLELYVPNEISQLLTIPNAKIVGDDILDGRPVTVIEAIADKSPPTPHPQSKEFVVLSVTDYKLWVDKETSQVLQREHKQTFIEGSNKGAIETQTFKVIANELEDASQVAPDLFKFKLPNTTVVEAESPFGATPTPGTTQASEFVPQGKVRYMKVARTWQSPGIDNGRIDELWLENGKEHMLLRTNTLHVNVSQHVREHGVMVTRVTDAAVYVYYKFGEDAYRHYKYPYDPRFIEPYVPHDINALLGIPRARIVGDETVNGRPVTLIESITDKPAEIAAPDPTQTESSMTDLRFWVDKESSLVLKRESVTTYLSGPRSGTTKTETFQIMLNELRDRSEVTVDFFDYEPSGTVIDSATSPFDATPTPNP